MLYSARYETKDLRHRVFLFFMMLGLIMMIIVNYVDPNDDKWDRFVTIIEGSGVIWVSSLLAYMHFTVAMKAVCKYEKQSLIMTTIGRVVNILLNIVVIIVYLYTESEEWYSAGNLLFYSQIIVWFVFDYFAMSNKNFVNTHSVDKDLIQERYSILFIVFTGELLIQTISVIAQNADSPKVLYEELPKIAVSFLLIFAWFWIYKELFNYPDLASKPKRIFIYTYAMLFILIALMISASAIALILNPSGETDKYGKFMLLISCGIWNFTHPIINFCLRPYKKEDHFVWPRKFEASHYFGPLLVACWIWIPFVKGVDGATFLYCMTAFSMVYVIYIEVVKIYIMKHISQNEEEYSKKVEIMKKKAEIWTKRKMAKHIDVEWHKQNDFNINIFSKMAKKLDDGTERINDGK